MARFEPRPFGKYFLTDLIAIGGMAEIYKAKTFGVDGFEKVLAIKKILPHYSADQEFITMLTDEAKLVVNLSHANIVQVYDLGRVDNDYFISMEFIDGINMRDLIEKTKILGEKIPPEFCIYIASEVCKGLDYAHNKKDENGNSLHIVHRDVSPQNILASFDGGIKIVDFGIAKAARNLSQTNIGILKGKVTYMAPEQAFGKPIDGRTDLFSLGIVLYEMLTLNRLFTGESQMEVLKKIRNTQITEDSFGEDVPEALKKVLAKVLSYSVKTRYQTASDLQVDLTRILYSHYSDFSPRKLNLLLQLWFQQQINKRQEPVESQSQVPQETVLVSSSTHQIEIVHHEDTQPALPEDPFSDTIRPEDQLTKEAFSTIKQLPVETENTERSDISSHEETLEQMIERKHRQAFFKKALLILIPLLAVTFFILFKFTDFFGHEQKNGHNQNGTNNVVVEFVDITVTTDPAGAKVWIEGQAQDQVTPTTFKKLEIGNIYLIKIQKEGYDPVEKSVTISKGMDTNLAVTLIETSPLLYDLTIQSIPSGARVFVDDQDMNFITPATLKDLKAGQTFRISLQLDDYQPYQKEFVSTSGDEQRLDVVLDAIPFAKVVISSDPVGADILVDGVKIGQQTPYTLESVELNKTLTITLQKSGYDEAQEVVEINEARDFPVEKVLIKKQELVVPVPLRVTSNVSGATVLVNDQQMGVTPLSIQLPPGSYKVVVDKGQYKPQSKTLEVKPGQAQKDYYFRLTPLTTPSTQQPVQQTNTTHQIINVSPIENTTSQNATSGRLRVDSSPRGASVKINGSAAGVTPIVVGNLPKNRSISVSVSKSGYGTWQTSITLSKDYTEVKAVLTQ